MNRFTAVFKVGIAMEVTITFALNFVSVSIQPTFYES